MSKLRPEITLATLNALGEEYLPGYLGIEITALAPNSLGSQMPVRKMHIAPNDFLHAASIVALADTTCGYATIAHLPEGAQSFTTIELKSNHLGTIREGSCNCVATAQHLGRTTQVWDAVVSDEASGRKLALFRCTQMILWPKNTVERT
ncbi:MAG: PaaI family thioesterase [Dechloromonas sp.]|nr:PaaI family thioesterase [Dechloromonas sp.]